MLVSFDWADLCRLTIAHKTGRSILPLATHRDSKRIALCHLLKHISYSFANEVTKPVSFLRRSRDTSRENHACNTQPFAWKKKLRGGAVSKYILNLANTEVSLQRLR